ncbi:MAG: rubredoxin, partial [Bacteroidota bacterium]
VDKIELPGLLMELSHLYFEQLGELSEQVDPTNSNTTDVIPTESHPYYECSSCFNQYDSRFGDALNQIEAGVPFEQLPDTYTCPICETPKSGFRKGKAHTNKTAFNPN